jgi:hypothetical protein
MAKKQITVTSSSGTTSGPFSIYHSSILNDNLLEANITSGSLASGKTYRVDRSIDRVLIVNTNSDCGNVVSLSI